MISTKIQKKSVKSKTLLSNFRKIIQKITLYHRQEIALMTQKKITQEGQRKQRTRTLIQLGGLLSKTKFLQLFQIEIGDDLQTQTQQDNKALMLFGLLKDLSQQLPDTLTQDQKELLKQKGLYYFTEK